MSMMTVQEMSESLLPNDSNTHLQTTLDRISVSSDGGEVILEDEITDEDEFARYQLDEAAERAIARFMKLPFTYIDKCPGHLKATNLNYWMHKADDEVDVMVNLGKDGIEALYDPSTTIVPTAEIGRLVTRLFKPEDEIISFRHDEKMFHIDVISQDMFIKVAPNGVGDRTEDDLPEVGDITNGGLRLLVPLDLKSKPTMTVFTNRLVCTNGMTMLTEGERDFVSLKGKTVPDILAEMEDKAKRLLEAVPDHLETVKQTTQVAVPGNPLNFMRAIAHEHRLSPAVVNRLMNLAGGDGDKEWSLYDVNQMFTRVANAASWATASKLQALAGYMTTNHEFIVRRCSTCEQPLSFQAGHEH
jgi:hypothetical protein